MAGLDKSKQKKWRKSDIILTSLSFPYSRSAQNSKNTKCFAAANWNLNFICKKTALDIWKKWRGSY